MRKYFKTILLSIGFLTSFLGMLIIKRSLEVEKSATDEFYFLMFQLLFIFIIGYTVLSWVFKKWKEYQFLKREKMKAELSNLKNQISPHFFFNTLNNLYGLVKKDQDKAQEFILKLSELMRYSIYISQKEMITIQEEIDFLQNFIELQKIRYHKKIEITFTINVESFTIKIAPLLLIILLENAFKHGVEKLTEDIYVHLELSILKNDLTFIVRNNFDSENTQNPGIGLENLRNRLHMMYHKKHTLTIDKKRNTYDTKLKLRL